MLWYAIVGFNVPFDTLFLISETIFPANSVKNRSSNQSLGCYTSKTNVTTTNTQTLTTINEKLQTYTKLNLTILKPGSVHHIHHAARKIIHSLIQIYHCNTVIANAVLFETHSLTAALDQLRVVASSTSNDPGSTNR